MIRTKFANLRSICDVTYQCFVRWAIFNWKCSIWSSWSVRLYLTGQKSNYLDNFCFRTQIPNFIEIYRVASETNHADGQAFISCTVSIFGGCAASTTIIVRSVYKLRKTTKHGDVKSDNIFHFQIVYLTDWDYVWYWKSHKNVPKRILYWFVSIQQD